ncbi:hypothetical protein PsW64_02741 [Pseudovibrio sp. W64]|nr:hypothetical protein PsW64_02741 [Pseudovibrio sp. W64]
MTISNLPMIRSVKPAWNRGRIVGQKRPLLPKHVWVIRVRLELAGKVRELALFNTAIDNKLRGCELVRLKIVDVFTAGRVKERTSIIQNKTGKPVQFELMEGTRSALSKWIDSPEMIGSEYLWLGRFHDRPHISTQQYGRMLKEWVLLIRLEPSSYGTHSMRRSTRRQVIFERCSFFLATQRWTVLSDT